MKVCRGAFEGLRNTAEAFCVLGYDYTFRLGSGMRFDSQAYRKEQTIPLNVWGEDYRIASSNLWVSPDGKSLYE